MIDLNSLNIKNMQIKELENLANNLREVIIDTVSKNGGHLSSNLGVVELSIAMHYVFDVQKDPFIFDVSHQSYPHKLLSGKINSFHTLRQFNGLSGYTKPDEGDYFIAGHSSTSISLAVGACKAIRLKKEDRLPVVLIGDGALSAGMAYEALNELGDREYPCVIILNDNEMSISKPIGAISKYLSQAMATQFYQKFKKRIENLLEYFPQGASYMAKRFEEGLRLITPGLLFEELGLEYIGPIDGHNLNEIINAL
ncbi:TPA: 1-deoxy-D-xylulose-5-phosphate synthase, partial [Campylobacter lari]|nr:1-deoxy-D-xylulose-5-phosphate synthase [Campylobacter lari]